MSTTLACQCWGELVRTAAGYTCLACGEVTPLDDERTEADCDLFEIEGAKLSVRELDGRAPWHPERDEYDARDDRSDIQPHERTTRYPW